MEQDRTAPLDHVEIIFGSRRCMVAIDKGKIEIKTVDKTLFLVFVPDRFQVDVVNPKLAPEFPPVELTIDTLKLTAPQIDRRYMVAEMRHPCRSDTEQSSNLDNALVFPGFQNTLYDTGTITDIDGAFPKRTASCNGSHLCLEITRRYWHRAAPRIQCGIKHRVNRHWIFPDVPGKPFTLFLWDMPNGVTLISVNPRLVDVVNAGPEKIEPRQVNRLRLHLQNVEYRGKPRCRDMPAKQLEFISEHLNSRDICIAEPPPTTVAIDVPEIRPVRSASCNVPRGMNRVLIRALAHAKPDAIALQFLPRLLDRHAEERIENIRPKPRRLACPVVVDSYDDIVTVDEAGLVIEDARPASDYRNSLAPDLFVYARSRYKIDGLQVLFHRRP